MLMQCCVCVSGGVCVCVWRGGGGGVVACDNPCTCKLSS